VSASGAAASGAAASGAGGAELSYVLDGDDVAIASLNGAFAAGVASLIAAVVQGRALDAVAAAAKGLTRAVEDCDAAAVVARLAEADDAAAEAAGREAKCWSRAEQRAAVAQEAAQREARRSAVAGLDQVVLSALCLVHNLLLFASQRTAQLRQHLATESCFLASAALPFVRLRLDRAAMAHIKHQRRAAAAEDVDSEDEAEAAAEAADMQAAGRAVLLGLRCFAVACFKLKVHR
jgi:hypothetical protein